MKPVPASVVARGAMSTLKDDRTELLDAIGCIVGESESRIEAALSTGFASIAKKNYLRGLTSAGHRRVAYLLPAEQ